MIISAIRDKITNTKNNPHKVVTRPYSPLNGVVLKFKASLQDDVVAFGAAPVTKAHKLKRTTVTALQGTLVNLSNSIIGKLKPYQPVLGIKGVKKINIAFKEALGSRHEIFKNSIEDLKFVLEKDPALREKDEKEAILYKSIAISFAYRVAHDFYKKGETTIARAISEAVKEISGTEIHPGATIGKQFFIDHPSGVVIGETARIGDRFHGHGNVLLGSDGVNTGKHRHPIIGNNVTIWPKANVHGNKKIGDNSTIGCGAVVTEDVPAKSVVVGHNLLTQLKGKKVKINLKEYWEEQKQSAIV